MPVYSQSKLSDYESCPQKYKLRYVDRIEPPHEGIELFLGSRAHETLEKLYKELLLTKVNSLEELLTYFDSQWEKNWHDNIVIMREGFTAAHYRKTGREAISNYYQRYHPFNQSKTLATEYRVNFTVDGYKISGVIDRLSHDGRGAYEVHDYKTSGSPPTQDELERDRQLALYQIGLREKFADAQKVNLIWHYLVFDKEFVATRTDAQLEDLKSEVTSLIKRIERDTRFEPHESSLCDWCAFPEYCPAKKHGFKVEALPANKYLNEEGVSLVNQYAAIAAKIKESKEKQDALEEELDQIKEAAVEYARKEGITSITGSDYLLKISEKEALEFPGAHEKGRDELESYLRKVGLWPDVAALNLSKLEKMVQEETVDPDKLDHLKIFAEESTKVSVRLVKKRETEE